MCVGFFCKCCWDWQKNMHEISSFSNKWKRAELFIRANSSRQEKLGFGTHSTQANPEQGRQELGSLICCSRMRLGTGLV